MKNYTLLLLLLTTLTATVGCKLHKQDAIRKQSAADIKLRVCGISSMCKVAALDGDNGPLLAIKYSRATDVLTFDLKNDTKLTDKLLNEGFVDVLVGDGQFYLRSWRLVRRAAEAGTAADIRDAELSRRIEEHVHATDEVEVQAAVDRSTGTLRLYSDQMSEAGAGCIVHDAELHSLMRANRIKRLVISDREMTWRDYIIPEDTSGFINNPRSAVLKSTN